MFFAVSNLCNNSPRAISFLSNTIFYVINSFSLFHFVMKTVFQNEILLLYDILFELFAATAELLFLLCYKNDTFNRCVYYDLKQKS